MKNHSFPLLAAVLFGLLLSPLTAAGQLPDFTRIVEQAKDSVVNISTSKKVNGGQLKKHLEIPELPEGSPFGELFKKLAVKKI